MKSMAFVSVALLLAGLSATTEPTGAQTALRDTRSDSWVATDALGRAVPLYGERIADAPHLGPIPAPRPKKFVGMFYFLWLGEHGRLGPFDNTKILHRDPDALQKPDSPLWGPVNAPHHWGESVFGYYLSRDEWVLRRHAQMLSDADVDVVIFDVSNNLTYPRAYRALGKVWSQMRRDGHRTPQIAFLTPFLWRPRQRRQNALCRLLPARHRARTVVSVAGETPPYSRSCCHPCRRAGCSVTRGRRFVAGRNAGAELSRRAAFTAIGGRFRPGASTIAP